ncbi:phosphoribosyltransferase family protein [Streptomyces sp. NPDC002164]|uniref:phosphoribosyltransferase family protein n=1 Tax=unclassified Streptomyces TaxID=2593676 RepID=UPI0036B551AC
MSAKARDLVLERFRWIDGHADVWAVFRDPVTLAAAVSGLVEPFRGEGITAVCGVESRGFLLGGAAAVALGVGFIPVRKAEGLFPGDKLVREASPDYRGLRHTLRLQSDSVTSGDRVLLVDDWIETGSQARAVKEMVIECGGDWAGCAVVVDQLDAEVLREKVGPVRGLLFARELPEDG